jgi:hypothetical protein
MGELFKNFEVGREARWPMILRLLVGSIALHATLIACVALIPPVRNALNIAAIVAGSNYVDKPYARTVFGEDIQMVQVQPKFQYPPGYFAISMGLALPSPSPSPTPDPYAPKIISEAKPLKPQSSPSPSPSASPLAAASPVIAKSQGSPNGQAADNKEGIQSGDRKTGDQKDQIADQAKKDEAERAEAQKKLEATAAANNITLPAENEINRQPIKDLTAYVDKLKQDGQLDLNKSFEVSIEGDVDAQGKLQKPTITQRSGDPKLADLATRAIGAINESGLLVYLKDVNEGRPTKVTFIISQNSDFLLARVESEVGSEDAARGWAQTFSLMLATGQITRKGKDEEVLMRNTKTSHEGKKLVFNFSMPRQTVVDMIKKQLATAAATKQG